MILSDNELKERYDEILPNSSKRVVGQIQPCSIDLHLSDDLKTVTGQEWELSTPYKLEPKEFILGSTIEFVNIPSDLVGMVNGKSSLGRLGLAVHITAGFIDAGFHGNITLELYNASNEPVFLYGGMPICQLVLAELTSPASKPYGHKDLGSKYQGSKGTILSRAKW